MSDIILMPRGIAVWLKKNTKLTEEQISNFCQIDYFTLNFINENNTVMFNPIVIGQLTLEDIQICEKNPNKSLTNILNTSSFVKQSKRKRITMMQKKNRPRFIGWVLKNYPKVNLEKLAKLFGCQEKTVKKLKETLQENTLEYFIDPIKQGVISTGELESLLAQ